MFQLTELGARLKEARERKGYSLDDLQEITKIQKRYLMGIEEGNYENMPGAFYIRAFIKQYAEAVDLNADELLQEFKRDVPSTQSEEVVQSYTTSPSRKKLAATKNKGMNEAMPKVIMALFGIVIIAVIAILISTKYNDEPPADTADEGKEYEYIPPKTTEPVEEEEEKPANTEEEPVQEEPVVQQVIAPGVVSGEDVVYEISNTDTLKIRVEVSGLTWVGIRDENRNEKIDDRTYNAGEVVEYDSTADGYARIRLGAAKNTKVFVNDEEVPFASDRVTQNFILKLVKEEQQ